MTENWEVAEGQIYGQVRTWRLSECSELMRSKSRLRAGPTTLEAQEGQSRRNCLKLNIWATPISPVGSLSAFQHGEIAWTIWNFNRLNSVNTACFIPQYSQRIKCGCASKFSLVAQTVKSMPAVWETRVQFLCWADPLEKEMATHYSILAWRIHGCHGYLGGILEEPSRLYSPWGCRVRHNWATSLSLSQHQGLFMSWLFVSEGQSIGASTSASTLPMNIQGWFLLGLTDLTSLQCKGLSRVFSSTTVQKHPFFRVQPSLWSNSHICTWLLEKP